MAEKTKANNSEKMAILECGDISFFYRPKVRDVQQNENITIKGIKDIQRFYILLYAKKPRQYRLIIVGKKKLPTIESQHEKDWAVMDFVTTKKQEIVAAFSEKSYSTRTRGGRKLAAACLINKGTYCIVAYARKTYLVYLLKAPKKSSDLQETLKIEPEASYVISVKNPNMPGRRSSKFVDYPEALKKKFKNLHFIPANPVDILNYAGTELLLIGAKKTVKKELDAKLKEEQRQ